LCGRRDGTRGGAYAQKYMFAVVKMVFVYLTLGGLAGVIGIPYSFVVGNVRLLYRVVGSARGGDPN
jgi:hypothetical protein